MTLVVAAAETIETGIVGYVEAATEEEVVGWSWRKGTDERLRVELRLDGEVIASSIADGDREDLGKNGIGDGRHGFRLVIPDHIRARAAQVQAVAIDADGRSAILNAPPVVAQSGKEIAELQRRLDMVLGSQRVLHRNVQAALLQHSQPLADSVAAIAASQARIDASIATVELFAVRLEQRLTATEVAQPPQQSGRWFQIVSVAATCAFVLAGVALWRSLSIG